MKKTKKIEADTSGAIKILFNCLTMQKGGAERVIASLSNEFIAMGNSVVVVSLIKHSEDKYELHKSIRRITIDKIAHDKASAARKILNKLSPQRLLKLRKVIVTEKPDIIISFLPEPSLRIMTLKKLSKTIGKIPTIISIRNDPQIEYKNPVIRMIMKYLYKNVEGMVFQTKEAKKYFKKILKTRNQAIICNPISDNFYIRTNNDEQREKTIIAIGRLEDQKNHKLLISAFSKITDKHGYILEIYGDGSKKTELEKLIKTLHQENYIFLKGQCDNIQEAMNSARIFVLPSKYEGMPNALLESMALGLSCISTDCPCGGPKEIIQNRINGILVPVNDVDEMASAINELIINDETRIRLGKNAKDVRQKYNKKNITKQWNNLIMDIIANKRKTG